MSRWGFLINIDFGEKTKGQIGKINGGLMSRGFQVQLITQMSLFATIIVYQTFRTFAGNFILTTLWWGEHPSSRSYLSGQFMNQTSDYWRWQPFSDQCIQRCWDYTIRNIVHNWRCKDLQQTCRNYQNLPLFQRKSSGWLFGSYDLNSIFNDCNNLYRVFYTIIRKDDIG